MKTTPLQRALLLLALLAGSVGPCRADYIVRIPVDDQRIATSPPPSAGPVTLTAPSFGDNAVNTTVVRTATLTNGKASAISVTVPSAASVTGTGFAFSSTTCGTTLAAGGSCTISVELTATAQGSYSGTLTVNASGAKTASLAATRSPAVSQVTFNPLVAEFGKVLYGQNANQTITVTNTGNTAQSSITFGSSGLFSVPSSTCQTTLLPGDSCTFNIRFSAGSYNFRGGYPSFTSDKVSTSLYAWGVVISTPPANLTFTDIDFGKLTPGVSATGTAVLTNNTGSTISISTVSNDVGNYGSFVLGNSCSSLNNGQSCTVTSTVSTNNYVAGAIRVQTSVGLIVNTMRGSTK